MKIYIVTNGAYSDYSIIGVFSTRDRAAKYVAEYGPAKYIEIEEYDVDEYQNYIKRMSYCADIDIETGAIITQHCEQRLADAKLRSGASKVKDFRMREKGILPSFGHLIGEVVSYESAEHALKLAAELRQETLRSVDINSPIVEKHANS